METEKTERGRPTKLNNDLIERICKAIRLGLTFKDAAMFAGIPERQFYAWKEKAEKPGVRGVFRQFSHDLKSALVQGKALHLKRIHEASAGGQSVTETRILRRDGKIVEEITIQKTALPVWTASAWILERRHPEEFGRHIQPPQANEEDPLDMWLKDLNDAAEKYGTE